jgi:hypothetical protein
MHERLTGMHDADPRGQPAACVHSAALFVGAGGERLGWAAISIASVMGFHIGRRRQEVSVTFVDKMCRGTHLYLLPDSGLARRIRCAC